MGEPGPTGPRIAVVGCGRWGANHLRVWDELGYLHVACDLDQSRLDEVARRHPGVVLSRSPAEVFARPDIDAVVVATPAATHFAVAAQAIRAGKDVLVEKPLALAVDDAEALVEMAGKASAVLMVGHVLEYHPAFVKLAELVRTGALGKVLYVYANRLNFGTVRTEESALWSFAPHDLALIVRILGGSPTDVACHDGAYLQDDVADVTLMALRFASGARAHVFVSWLHPFKEHRFIVVGDRQMAIVDDTAPWPEKLLVYPQRVDWVDGQVPVARKAEAAAVSLDEAEPLRVEAEHFVACIRDRTTPLTDGASGARVLHILDAGERSLRQGGAPVTIGERSSDVVIHSSATVDRGAVVGERTRVWHHSHVMAGARIGSDCMLGQNSFVADGVLIGNGVRIQNNVSVYSGVELEDDVFCGPSAVFTNVDSPRSELGAGGIYERTLVKRGATIGANATVVCGVTIGRYALVAAGAVVTADVADHALVVGVPARFRGWRCRCGEPLDFTDGAGASAACPLRYRLDDGRAVVLTG